MTTLPKRVESGALSQLLQQAKSEDQFALGKLFKYCEVAMLELVRKRIYGRARRKVGASDVVQGVFPLVQGSIRYFRGQTSRELFAWLRTITLHHLSNQLRPFRPGSKQDLEIEVSIWEPHAQGLPVNSDSPSTIAVANEESEIVARALAQLSERDHQVIIWRNYDRLSFAEIGKNLNCSAEAARKIWARTVVRLKKLLENPNAAGGSTP